MPGRQHTFAYDNAGNRTAASNDDSLPQSETVNALGQITRKENKSIHVSGVADEGVTVAARTDEGVSTVRAAASAGRFWSIELSVNAATDTGAGRANTNVYLGKPAPSPEEDNIIKTVPLALFMSPKKEAFAYDADGNLTSDGQWIYTYDAENRLVAMQTKDALIPALLAHTGGERALLINFTYDYASRRAAKRVQEKIDGQWQERYHHRYVYNGSALIAEIDAGTGAILRSFAWGATGELLMIHDRTASAETYLPVRDASGSVTGLLRARDKATVATYEYDPNGNLLRAQGAYAQKNPFTWASGWMDWETGLTNASSVYYAPRLGRSINGSPSGGGSGIVGNFGVALSAGYQPLRAYARPAARRNAVTERVSTIDPAERAAYESAWAAFETAWASYETAAVAYEKWLYDYIEQSSGQVTGSEAEDIEAGYFGDFLSSSQGYHFTGTFGSFDMGLSPAPDADPDPEPTRAKKKASTSGKGNAATQNDKGGSTPSQNNSGGTAVMSADGDVVIMETFVVTATRLAPWPVGFSLAADAAATAEWDILVRTKSVEDLSKTADIYIKSILEQFKNGAMANAMLKKAIADTRTGKIETYRSLLGKRTAETRRENAIFGYVSPDGSVTIAGTNKSMYNEKGAGNDIEIPVLKANGIQFVIHTHTWDQSMSGADFDASAYGEKGVYIFTIPVDTERVQVLSPNRGKAYEGSISLFGL